MIIPDVNVLVYAYRLEADHHAAYASWLNDVVAGDEDLGLVESVLTGLVRIVTNPRVVPEPPPPGGTPRLLGDRPAGPRGPDPPPPPAPPRPPPAPPPDRANPGHPRPRPPAPAHRPPVPVAAAARARAPPPPPGGGGPGPRASPKLS